MPLPLLAHQAPVLPLKLWRPALFNGTALVIGSLAPDIEYFQDSISAVRGGFPHTIKGQFFFCLPFTLAFVVLIGGLRIGDTLAARVPSLAFLAGASRDVLSVRGLVRAIVSAVVGSFSHIGFDKLTHEWVPDRLPEHTFTLFGQTHAGTHTLVQLIATVLASVATLAMLRSMAKKTTQRPAERPGGLIIAMLALLGVGLGMMCARPAMRDPDSYFDAGALYVWGHFAFFISCGAGVGVIAACAALSVWDRQQVV